MGVDGQLGADQREAAARCCLWGTVLTLHLPPFPCPSELFGTARSSQGRTVCVRRSEPLTARTVLEDREEGKGGGGLRGCPPGGGPGQRPEHLTARVVGARHQEMSTPLNYAWHGCRLAVPQSRGAVGDSSFTARKSAAFAWRIVRAASVSLIRLACRSSISKVIPGLRNLFASGSDLSFS